MPGKGTTLMSGVKKRRRISRSASTQARHLQVVYTCDEPKNFRWCHVVRFTLGKVTHGVNKLECRI